MSIMTILKGGIVVTLLIALYFMTCHVKCNISQFVQELMFLLGVLGLLVVTMCGMWFLLVWFVRPRM